MRNFVLKCILLLSFVTPCQESVAQRVNKKGYKLVKSLDIKWCEGDREIDWMCRKINYYYDSEGKLTGIDERYKDDGHEYFSTCRMDSDGKFARGHAYKDGAPIQGSEVLIKPYTFIAQDAPVVMDDGNVATCEKKVYEHKIWKGNSHVISTRTYFPSLVGQYDDYKRESDKFFEDVSNGVSHDLYGERSSELRDWGFVGTMPTLYAGKDGLVYAEGKEDYNVSYIILEGNVQLNYERWYSEALRKDLTTHEDQYTDKVNDTNIDYICFSKIGSRIWNRLELATEWLPWLRSRNLLRYENRQYIYGKEDEERVRRVFPEKYYKTYPDGKIIYDVEWNYRYEGGNLVEITIDTKAQGILVGARRGVIKISYEY